MHWMRVRLASASYSLIFSISVLLSESGKLNGEAISCKFVSGFFLCSSSLLFQHRTGISTLREVFTSKNVWLFQISKYYFRESLSSVFLTEHPLLQWLYIGNLLYNNYALIFMAHYAWS